MTRKKLKFLIRTFLLVLVAAIVLRPVAVCLQNGAAPPTTQQEGKAFAQQASAHQTTFRNIEREAPDVTLFVPGISKVKAPSPLVSRLNPVFVSGRTSSPSSLVLRI